MSENITLVSKEYTSRFVTGPELQTELSKKQNYVGLSLDNDQNVVQVDLRGFSQIGSNKSNYFDGPVKFSSPIYDKNDNEITGGGGDDTDKSDKWFCVAFYVASDLAGFDEFKRADDIIKEVWTWKGYGHWDDTGCSFGNCAVITFQKPMSMVEINSYFATEKLVMGGMGNIVESGLFPMIAVCPYDGNLPSDAHSTFTPGPVL